MLNNFNPSDLAKKALGYTHSDPLSAVLAVEEDIDLEELMNRIEQRGNNLGYGLGVALRKAWDATLGNMQLLIEYANLEKSQVSKVCKQIPYHDICRLLEASDDGSTRIHIRNDDINFYDRNENIIFSLSIIKLANSSFKKRDEILKSISSKLNKCFEPEKESKERKEFLYTLWCRSSYESFTESAESFGIRPNELDYLFKNVAESTRNYDYLLELMVRNTTPQQMKEFSFEDSAFRNYAIKRADQAHLDMLLTYFPKQFYKTAKRSGDEGLINTVLRFAEPADEKLLKRFLFDEDSQVHAGRMVKYLLEKSASDVKVIKEMLLKIREWMPNAELRIRKSILTQLSKTENFASIKRIVDNFDIINDEALHLMRMLEPKDVLDIVIPNMDSYQKRTLYFWSDDLYTFIKRLDQNQLEKGIKEFPEQSYKIAIVKACEPLVDALLKVTEPTDEKYSILKRIKEKIVQDKYDNQIHIRLANGLKSFSNGVTEYASPLIAAYQYADDYAGGYLNELVGGVTVTGAAAAFAYSKYKDYKLVKEFKAALENNDTEAAVALAPDVKPLITTEDLLTSLRKCHPACILSVLKVWKLIAFPIEIFDTDNLTFEQALINQGAIVTPTVIHQKLLNAFENEQSERADFWFDKLCKEPFDVQPCGEFIINYTRQMSDETAKKMCSIGTSQPRLKGFATKMLENATLKAFHTPLNDVLSQVKFENKIRLILLFKNQFNVKLDQSVQSTLSEKLIESILNHNSPGSESILQFLQDNQLFSDTLNNPAWMDDRLLHLLNGPGFFGRHNPMTIDKLNGLFNILQKCSLERPEWQALFEKFLKLAIRQNSLPMFKMLWRNLQPYCQLDPNKFLTLAVKTTGSEAILKFLIEEGANPNHLKGKLVLDAVKANCIPQVKILLENGADVRTDETIFLKILESGNDELISCLYENGFPGFFVNNQSKEIYQRLGNKVDQSADCFVPNKWFPITRSEALPEVLELLQNAASTVYNYDAVDHVLPKPVVPTLQFLARNAHTKEHEKPMEFLRDFADGVDAFKKDVRLIEACKRKIGV